VRIRQVLVLAVLFMLGFAGTSSTEAENDSRLQQIKVAYVYKFSGYVEWPETHREDRPAFTVGVLGDNPFGSALFALESRTYDDKPGAVRQIASVAEASSCHIPLISDSERGKLDEIVAALHAQSVLTVSEIDGFVEAGGMIQLMVHKNKVRFSINLNAARQAKLDIDARLLALARQVIQ